MPQFGFLKNPIRGSFSGVVLAPLPDHAERLEWFEEKSNRDGFFYPPQMATYELDLKTHEKNRKIERSERPASVFHLPESHDLVIGNPLGVAGSPFADDALIIHLLAFVYGTRLQVSGWRFEGRIPNKSTNNIYVTDDACLDFLEHVYGWWRALENEEKRIFINILYVLTRAKSLEWDWDAFAHQYMVFDALYKLHTKLYPSREKVTHRKRFDVLLSAYGVPANDVLVDRMHIARNQLFHEAMWVDSAICYGSGDADAFYLPHHLGRLNSRLICGISGYRNEYAGSVWWAMGCFLFGNP